MSSPHKGKGGGDPADPSKPNNKLRTSKDVYDRLTWDPESIGIGVDPSTIFIGYKDRFLGMCEIPFTSYNPGEDIPYHRIYYFRSGGPPVEPMIGELGEVRVREDNFPEGYVMLWDREERIDLIFNSGRTSSKKKGSQRMGSGERSNSRIPVPTGFVSLPSFTFNNQWTLWEKYEKKVKGEEDKPIQSLRIVTYNILHDLHEDNNEQLEGSDSRWGRLLKYLEDLKDDVDVIAFEEVTPSFLALVESKGWVRENYFLSEITERSNTISPYGQVVLSKYPMEELYFCDHKDLKTRFLLPIFHLNESYLAMPVIHLRSDYHGNKEDVRKAQVDFLLEACHSLERGGERVDILMVGDVNCFNTEGEQREEEALTVLKEASFKDLWTSLKNDEDPGLTFDLNNPLAESTSKQKRNGRLDRFFLRSDDEAGWIPAEIKLLGNEEQFTANPLSDHYGLHCVLQYKDNVLLELEEPEQILQEQVPSSVPKKLVYTSSVIASPLDKEGTEFWDFVQDIRSKYDPSYKRWMPHINLVYAFIEDDVRGINFAEANRKFQVALQHMEPFQCKFSSIQFFHHKNATVVYLAPEPLNKMKELQRRLESEYPMCNEQSTKSSDGFIPHLTLGKISHSEMKRMQQDIERWKRQLEKFNAEGESTFLLDSIYLISRAGKDTPFEVRHSVGLGGPSSSRSPLTTSPSSDGMNDEVFQAFLSQHKLIPTPDHENLMADVLKEIRKLCKMVLDHAGFPITEDEVPLHVCGSRAMGFHHDKSDLDLLISGPFGLSISEFFENFSQVVSTSYENPDFTFFYTAAEDTLVPVSRFSLRGIKVDLVYSNLGIPLSEEDIMGMSESEIGNLDPTKFRCITSVRDGHALFSILKSETKLDLEEFRNAVRFVRFWAKRRGIYGSGFCWLFSLLYSVLMGSAAMDLSRNRNCKAGDIIVAFFTKFSKWRWPNPVHLVKGQGSPTKGLIGRTGRSIPELMPIHTPSFPYENKARTITKSTLAEIRSELQRGFKIISENGGNLSSHNVLEMLTEKLDSELLDKYPSTIQVELDAVNLLDLQICTGFLHSQLLKLVIDLERKKVSGLLIRPLPRLLVTMKFKDGNEAKLMMEDDQLDFESIKNVAQGNEDKLLKYIVTTFVCLDMEKGDIDQLTRGSIQHFIRLWENWRLRPAGSNMGVEVVSSATLQNILK